MTFDGLIWLLIILVCALLAVAVILTILGLLIIAARVYGIIEKFRQDRAWNNLYDD